MPAVIAGAAAGAAVACRRMLAPCYKLYAIGPPVSSPQKPGMVRVMRGGTAIALEVFDLPLENIGALLTKVPSPLAIGSVELEDGSTVKGFICEAFIAEGGPGIEDISSHGGYAQYVFARDAA